MPTIVQVRAKPGSKQNQIVLLSERNEHGQLQLDIRMQARAVEGKANAALIKLLATSLGVRQSSVSIVRGEQSRTKIVQIDCEEKVIKQLLGGMHAK